MKCKGCGAELTKSQLFCPHCGTKNEPVAEITKKCVNCGKGFPEGKDVCDICGGKLVPIQPVNSPNMSIPNQIPPYQMPSNQVPPNQMPQSAPNQSQPRQMPPYQMPGQMPQGQFPPNVMPPYPQVMPTTKKKNAALPIFIVVGAVVFILIGSIGIISFMNFVNKQHDVPDPVYSPSDDDTDIGSDYGSDDSNNPSGDDTIDNGTDVNPVNYLYSYSELPDTISIDSDTRFTYYDYAPEPDGITVYTYSFNDTSVSDDDFVAVVEDYCTILTTMNGYVYEDALTQELNTQTELVSEYFSKEDLCIGVTASVLEEGRYAYISIFNRSAVDSTSEETTTSDYPDYTYYLEGRDSSAFDQYTDVYMENGIAFNLKDIYLTDNGDGTAVLECGIDLGTTIESSDLYVDDFLVLPMDADGNALSDVCKFNSITDSSGNSLTTPVVLDTENFYSYNISFTVPSDTKALTFYGTNISLDDTAEGGVAVAGPAYYIDITFN